MWIDEAGKRWIFFPARRKEEPDFLVYDALREGKLTPLLQTYQTVALDIYAVYTSRRQIPLKLRYLIDFLVASFAKPVWTSIENQ